MKSILTFGMILCCIAGCSQKKSFNDDNVVKIITTRAYEAKQNFEDLIPDKPAQALGYDSNMGLNWSWRRIYYDKYSNAVRVERLTISNGQEEVYEIINNEYYSLEKHKLSSISTVQINNGSKPSIQKYIRNENGRLLKIIKQNRDSSINEKIIYYYNDTGQKIKEETYLSSGLEELVEFVYDLPDLKNGKMTKKIEEHFGKYKYRNEYLYSNEGDSVISVIKKCFERGELLSEKATVYSNFYKGNFNTNITKGYDEPITTIYGDGHKETVKSTPFVRTLNITRDSNNNILECNWSTKFLEKHKGITPGLEWLVPDKIETIYKCEYTYNDKNDWKQILFTSDRNSKFLIIRDIEYIDK